MQYRRDEGNARHSTFPNYFQDGFLPTPGNGNRWKIKSTIWLSFRLLTINRSFPPLINTSRSIFPSTLKLLDNWSLSLSFSEPEFTIRWPSLLLHFRFRNFYFETEIPDSPDATPWNFAKATFVEWKSEKKRKEREREKKGSMAFIESWNVGGGGGGGEGCRPISPHTLVRLFPGMKSAGVFKDSNVEKRPSGYNVIHFERFVDPWSRSSFCNDKLRPRDCKRSERESAGNVALWIWVKSSWLVPVEQEQNV